MTTLDTHKSRLARQSMATMTTITAPDHIQSCLAIFDSHLIYEAHIHHALATDEAFRYDYLTWVLQELPEGCREGHNLFRQAQSRLRGLVAAYVCGGTGDTSMVAHSQLAPAKRQALKDVCRSILNTYPKEAFTWHKHASSTGARWHLATTNTSPAMSLPSAGT